MATFSHMTVIAALFLIVLVNLAPIYVRADEIVYEEGYTVTTVLDGHKKGLNPYSVLPQSLYSSDLFVLDSSRNAFYTVSFPDSRESVIKKYSGNGVTGFSDGELASAKFNKPKSFTVDFRGNIYVADKNNHAIRKISNSGVTTIAGGSSQTPGNADGPARNASFSNDFELSFSPERCALMISDHGNMLLRQINLRAENCANGSQSVQGMTSAWAWALGFACLLGGLIIGFVIRPYVFPYTGMLRPTSVQRDMEAFPNQSGEENTDALLRTQKRSC